MYLSKFNKVFALRDDLFVLYNTLSSSLDVVDRNVLSTEEVLQGDESSALSEFLLDRGYLYPEETDEARYLAALSAGYRRFRNEIRPLIFYLVLTYRCNLACDYCFQRTAKTLDGTLGSADLDLMFDAVAEIRALNSETRTRPVVALFGGEPLLRRNLRLIERVFQTVADRGYVNGPIISNGVHLDAFVPLFREHRPSGVQVTIDGPAEVHDRRRPYLGGKGTFSRILANVDQALENGLKLGIRTNLDERNIECLPALADLAERHGWIDHDHVQLSLAPVHERACGSYVEDARHDAIFERVLESMKRDPRLAKWTLEGWSVVNYFRRQLDGEDVLPRFDHCEAAVGKSFHLDGYGNIYTCIEACGMPEYAAGRFLPKVEFYDLFEEFKRRDVMSLERCRACPFALICGGGCGLQALIDTKTLVSPHCGDTERALSRYVQYRYGN